MRRAVSLLGVLIPLLLLTGCSSQPPAAPKPKIAVGVLPFDARAGIQPGEAESVGDLFAGALQKTGRFTVVERAQLSTLLKEQGFQATQDDNGRLASAGKVLAIRKMISGSLGKLGSKYVFHLKMIDVESSTVDLALSQTYDDDLEDIGDEFIPEIVDQIVQAVDATPSRK